MSATQTEKDSSDTTDNSLSRSITESHEPERDTSLVFHTSRIAQQGGEISGSVVEVIATYDIHETYNKSEYTEEDVDGLITVDTPEKIPYVNKAVKLKLDGHNRVCEILPKYYLRIESDDLLTDVFLPIKTYTETGKRKYNVGAKLRKFKKFIGDQSEHDVPYLVPNDDVMGNSIYNIEISPEDVTFDMDNLHEKTVEPENTTEEMSNRISELRDGNIGLFGKVILMATLVMGIPLMGIFTLGPLVSNFPSEFPFAVLSIYYVAVAAFVSNAEEWFGITMEGNVSTETNPSHNKLDFDYQFDCPSDAHSVYQFGDDISTGDMIPVETEIDDEAGVCRIIEAETDKVWDVELEDGMMGEELVEWFEKVGSEKIGDKFTVRKTMYPDDDALRVAEDVFLVPPS